MIRQSTVNSQQFYDINRLGKRGIWKVGKGTCSWTRAACIYPKRNFLSYLGGGWEHPTHSKVGGNIQNLNSGSLKDNKMCNKLTKNKKYRMGRDNNSMQLPI